MNKKATLVFLLALLGVSYFYRYHKIVFKKPQSVHKWRQADCAAIALNYYQGDMNFFKSETHNLTSDGGTSGLCLTSEVPILYYAVAVLYKIFGYHDYIYRLFNTLLFFLGLFFLFKLFWYLLKDGFWAITLTLLFFTAPVLVYYGNNYLSNSSSFAFAIIAWYYFVRFLNEKVKHFFYLAMVFFLVAAAFKVTALFSLFSVLVIVLLELLGMLKLEVDKKRVDKAIQYLLPILLVLIVIGIWIIYAASFNRKHDCSYFSTTIFPIWDLDKETIQTVVTNVKEQWLNLYFHPSVLWFLLVCLVFVIWHFKRNDKVFNISIAVIFIEVIVYALLQFWTFAQHDYYVIDVYILPLLIVLSTFNILSKRYTHFFQSWIFKGVFTVFLVFNIFYAIEKNKERYSSYMNDYPQNRALYSVKPYLRKIGVLSNDTVISIPDVGHSSLYLMNLKGWTEYTDAKFNKGERIPYNQDSVSIQQSINKGAKYLIINGKNEVANKPYLRSYCTRLIGEYKSIFIYDLRGKKR